MTASTESTTPPVGEPTARRGARRDALRALAESYARHAPVRSVAIVGNRPMSPDPDRAAAVDGCDLVLRVNGFRLDDAGDEPTYGRRADVVFFHRGVVASRWFFQDYQDRLYLLVEPGRLHGEREALPDWWPTDLGQVHVSNEDLTLALSRDLGFDTVVAGTWATTGTMAAWWARDAFPDAHLEVTGFSFHEEEVPPSWQHASGRMMEINAEHDLGPERRFMREWVRGAAVRYWT